MEQPNLSVIQEISEGDSDFENSILEILKKMLFSVIIDVWFLKG